MKSRGFTLIELLAVVAVIGIIMALVVPSFTSINRAQAITSGGAVLIDELATARQTALAQNRVVEVRFYKRHEQPGVDDGSTPKFRAFNTVIFDEEVRQYRPLTSVQSLAPRVVVLEEPQFSTLIHPYSSTVPSRAFREEKLPEGTVTYQAIRFRPTGGTDLSPAGAPGDDKWFLTVTSENEPRTDDRPGNNYATLMLDPVSGRVRAFRP